MPADESPLRVRKWHLDGLRGVAACMVLLGHVINALFPSITLAEGAPLTKALGSSPLALLWNGNSGVCVFFALSGFVLTALSRRSPLSFPAQVLRRYLRLVIPMLLTSTFAWALLAMGLYENRAASELTHSWWLSRWYQFPPSFPGMVAETTWHVFLDSSSIYNPNLWTMQLELTGSLYIFFINAVIANRVIRTVGYLLIAVMYLGEYMPLFSVGALLFEYHSELSSVATKFGARVRWLMLAVTIAGLYLCSMPIMETMHPGIWYAWLPRLTTQSNEVHWGNEMHWHMIGAALILFTTLYWSFMHKVLGGAIGRLLGRISFTLYLIQMPIVCSFTAWLVISLSFLPHIGAGFVTGAATIVLIVAAANALHRFVDELPTRFSREAGRALDATFPPVAGGLDRTVAI
jgi:peptidoglycan/LPS O-acetylase OafA/YrhL